MGHWQIVPFFYNFICKCKVSLLSQIGLSNGQILTDTKERNHNLFSVTYAQYSRFKHKNDIIV